MVDTHNVHEVVGKDKMEKKNLFILIKSFPTQHTPYNEITNFYRWELKSVDETEFSFWEEPAEIETVYPMMKEIKDALWSFMTASTSLECAVKSAFRQWLSFNIAVIQGSYKWLSWLAFIDAKRVEIQKNEQ